MSETATTPYPIIAQLRLEGPRGLVGRNRERLKQIPTERTGIGLVLDVNGVLHEVENGMPIRKAYGINTASAVILVELRRLRLTIPLRVPSYRSHIDFQATATFHCQVRSASAFLDARVEDFPAELAGWATDLLRRRSRAIDPQNTAELESIGREMLTKGISRDPVVPGTVIAMDLASFEVHVDEQVKKAVADKEEREKRARARIHQLQLDDDIDEQEDILKSNRADRERRRRDTAAKAWEEAVLRGPEAMMAYLLAEDPSRIDDVLNRQLQDKAALYQLLIEVTRSPHIDGSVMEPYAKRLAEIVGHQLKVGPGFAEPGGLTEGSSWASESLNDEVSDDGEASSSKGTPWDDDRVSTDDVIEADASVADTAGPSAGPSPNGSAAPGATDDAAMGEAS